MNLDGLKLGDVVEIVFDDFTTKDAWQDLSTAEAETPAEIKHVGIYLNHDELVIRTVSSMVTHDKSVCALSMVPIGALKSVKKLEAVDVGIEEK